MNLLVLPGDGIGPEITAATVAAVEALANRFGINLALDYETVGLEGLALRGSTITEDLLDRAKAADGVILGPMSTYEYPPSEEGGINASSYFRTRLELYANIRPSRVRPGIPAVAQEMDLVIVRENLEDFYTDRNMAVGIGEFMPTDDVALAVGKITALGTSRIARAGFELAMRRRRHVTVVHKANVLRLYNGLFLREFHRVAEDYPQVAVDEVIVDAMAALLIRTPERFDVVVTTNMFGDILSDEAAELSGGLGLGPSLNHGDDYAVAQAAHGSAPDIAGQDRANPTALMQSVAMLLEHQGARQGNDTLAAAGQCLNQTIEGLLADPATRTADLGGALGTAAFGEAVATAIRAG